MNVFYQIKKNRDLLRSLLMLVKLRRHEHWTAEQLAQYQRKQLSSLISYAAVKSPYYRDLYRNIRFDREIVPGDLPVTSKSALMENFDRFVTDPQLKLTEIHSHIRQIKGDEYYLGKYRVLTTSGSSGLKGIFVFNRNEWSTILAGFFRSNLMTGSSLKFPVRLKQCTIFAGNPMHASYRMIESGKLHLINTLRRNAVSSIESHVRALNTFQPDILSAYPSIVSLLAIEQIEGRLRIHPAIIGIGGETCTEEMKLHIQDAWDITPFNLYGTTEGGAFNIDCPLHAGIHIAEDLTIMEVVDENNQPVPDGSPGFKLLITNLFNYTQPIIRYEISDMVTITSVPCSCGRPFRRIVRIAGRNNDIIYLRDNSGNLAAVHPLHFDNVLGVMKDIKEYRVVHDDSGLMILAVPGSYASNDDMEKEIRQNLLKSLRILDVTDTNIRVQFTNAIPRDHDGMGKFKHVQSNVTKADIMHRMRHPHPVTHCL